MWVFLSSRVRTWLLLAVAVPVARRVLRFVADRTAHGPDEGRATRTLRKADGALARVDRRERKRRKKAQKRQKR